MEKETVLVVDDYVDICEVIYDWLVEEYGFNVISAHSGNDALKILSREPIDHLITDVKMPNGSGLDLLLGIKMMNIQLNTIMVITGHSDIEEKDFRAHGADFFFHKPLDLFKISSLLAMRSQKKKIA